MTHCPLCHSLMDEHLQEALLPNRPDKVYLHCTNHACDLSCFADDLADFDASLYTGDVRTSAARTKRYEYLLTP